MTVLCPSCGAQTKMAILAGQFLHLGSGKDSMGKHFINNTKHEPICLWCGYEFEAVKKALKVGGA